MELPEGSRVRDLTALLAERYPSLKELLPRLAVAVDGELASTEAPLGEGAEVALLPPVSGGSGPAEARAPRVLLTEEALDAEALSATVRRPGYGAVLTFLGTVRDSHEGRSVTHLTYSAYRSMALRRLAAIVDDLEASGEVRAAIAHRLGPVPAGEASVTIVVASPHRDAAYEASRTALERLKKEVPIWKREHFADGEGAWREVEPLAPSLSPASV